MVGLKTADDFSAVLLFICSEGFQCMQHVVIFDNGISQGSIADTRSAE